MQTYTVTVDAYKTIRWFKVGFAALHRLDGPAVEYAKGDKYWYLDGVSHTEEEFLKKTQPELHKQELTVAQIEELLGYPIKIVK